MTDVCRPRRFPPLCGIAALWGSWVLVAVGGAVSVWAGLGFHQNVSMMWLISCFASFLCSCLLLEPLKVRLGQTVWVSSPGQQVAQITTEPRTSFGLYSGGQKPQKKTSYEILSFFRKYVLTEKARLTVSVLGTTRRRLFLIKVCLMV